MNYKRDVIVLLAALTLVGCNVVKEIPLRPTQTINGKTVVHANNTQESIDLNCSKFKHGWAAGCTICWGNYCQLYVRAWDDRTWKHEIDYHIKEIKCHEPWEREGEVDYHLKEPTCGKAGAL